MTVVVVGVVADQLGFASQVVAVPYGGPTAGRNFDVRTEYFAVPSTEYRSAQPEAIRVDVDHRPDRTIGTVKYLELAQSRKLYAVCEIDGATLGEGPWHYSPEIRHVGRKDIELRALAVTKNPASVALGPLQAFPGDLHSVARGVVFQDGHTGELIKRADEYDRQRGRGAPTIVHDRTTPKPAPELPAARAASGAIEYRSARSVDVNSRRRVIELVAVPYNTEASVVVRGRTITESFSNIAFKDIHKQTGRIIATRDHDWKRLFGRVVDVQPFHPEGLHATIQASNTPLGNETVELARDGILDASVGFSIPPGGEQWTGSSRRKVVKARLHEIALTPDPAYAGARVLDVRGPRSAVR